MRKRYQQFVRCTKNDERESNATKYSPLILLDLLEGWVVRTFVRIRSAEIGRITLMIRTTSDGDDGDDGDGDSGNGEPVRRLAAGPWLGNARAVNEKARGIKRAIFDLRPTREYALYLFQPRNSKSLCSSATMVEGCLSVCLTTPGCPA